MSNDDRVAMNALYFATAESAGAACLPQENEDGVTIGEYKELIPSSLDQLCIPLPAWAYRAGPRETIFFNPKETRVASKQSMTLVHDCINKYIIWLFRIVNAYGYEFLNNSFVPLLGVQF